MPTAYVGIVERMSLPGATTLSSGPWFENPETASAASVEPTQITPGKSTEYAAGKITGPPLSLPAAAQRIIPRSLA